MKTVIRKILIIMFCIFTIAGCSKSKPQELILYDFESESVLDEVLWKCHTLFSISKQYVVHGQYSLKLEMFPTFKPDYPDHSSYPGLTPFLKHNNWRNYNNFSFEVYNPSSEQLKIALRIDDKKQALEFADRYNNSFTIMPGFNTLTIPLNTLKTSKTDRPLNLKTIYRFLIFMPNPDKKYVLYLDYFRLLQ